MTWSNTSDVQAAFSHPWHDRQQIARCLPNARLTHRFKRWATDKFFGHEETQDGGILPDGYQVTITCQTRISRDGPFMGLVQRRHDDGNIFAIKAQFVRANGRSIEEVLADKVGSYERPEDIARMSEDIPGFQALMSELRRSADDVSGGLML